MLALTDPLWEKLDDAHRDLDIPAVLSELLSIAERSPDLELTSLLRNFHCTFVCSKCGKEGPAKSL